MGHYIFWLPSAFSPPLSHPRCSSELHGSSQLLLLLTGCTIPRCPPKPPPAEDSFWPQRQLHGQNLTQYLARKRIPDNQCIWQTGKGSQLWEIGSQCIPFTHTTLFSPAEQLGASWNPRTSLPPDCALCSGFKTITQLFGVRKVSQGGDKLFYFSPCYIIDF